MTIEIFGAIAVFLGVLGFFLGVEFTVTVFIVSTIFGASAALVLDALGGSSIQPAHLLLCFALPMLMAQPGVLRAAGESVAFPRPGFWLLVTVLYAVLSSIFLPRIFANATYVFAVRVGSGSSLVPLAPSTTNITQSVYLIGGLLCFVLLNGYCQTTSGKRVLATAALACVVVNLLFAVADLVTHFTGTTELMSFVRNASYRMLNDAEISGFKRIVGAFPEASSFGYITLGYFAFTLRLWLCGAYPRVALLLTALSFIALVFSTSTTAYVGLSVFVGIIYLESCGRLLMGSINKQTTLFLIAVPIGLLMIAGVAIFNTDVGHYLVDMAETMVLNKMSTDSGIERASMNSRAMLNFYETFMLGAGNGSLRASSFPVAILATIGIFGAFTYAAFFIGLFASKLDPIDPTNRAIQSAAKSACLAWLIAMSVTGAFIDLGTNYYVFAALACAQPALAGRRHASQVITATGGLRV